MASECRPDGPHRTAVLPEIQFGVELEIIGLDTRQAANWLVGEGIPCQVGAYGSSAADGNWNATNDATVHGGCEVKSPHLTGMEGLDQLARVARILSEAGASVDRSCGMHVHIDARDFKAIQMRRILMLWVKHRRALEWYASPDRRENHFCQPLPETMWEQCPKRGHIDNIIRTTIRRSGVRRDRQLNLCAYERHGTIECRLHEGTLDPDVIQSWVIFMLRLCDSCREVRFGWGDGPLPRNINSLRSLMQKIGLYPAWCYYRYQSPEMSKAAGIVRRRFTRWCKLAGVDPDPKEGPDKGPGWKPRGPSL